MKLLMLMRFVRHTKLDGVDEIDYDVDEICQSRRLLMVLMILISIVC